MAERELQKPCRANGHLAFRVLENDDVDVAVVEWFRRQGIAHAHCDRPKAPRAARTASWHVDRVSDTTAGFSGGFAFCHSPTT